MKTVLLAALILAWGGFISLPAQTASSGVEPATTSAATKLDQLEAIYQQQMKGLHVPLLSRYVTELQQMALSDPRAELELKRVQTIISSGGVVDLREAARDLNPDAKLEETTSLTPPKSERKAKILAKVTVLTPASALQVLPKSPEKVAAALTPISQVLWSLKELSAGEYDGVIQYTPLGAMEQGSVVEITLADQKVSLLLPAVSAEDLQMKRPHSIARFGPIQLDEGLVSPQITLSCDSMTGPKIALKSLILMRRDRKLEE